MDKNGQSNPYCVQNTPQDMKTAIVYDRVNKFGGAERVLLELHKIFPKAPLYTLVYDQNKAPWAKVFDVRPTSINSVPFLRSHHEILAPIAPMLFETLNLSEFDLIISVTSTDAKAVITKPGTLHVCYCLTPTRYFWSGEKNYSSDIKMTILPKKIREYFRTVDLVTSSRPDVYIAISNEVKMRISKYYGRESDVVYPSIDDKFYTSKPVDGSDRDHYLVVSRLVPYKKVDLVIRAFNKLKSPLYIIGSGNEMEKLKRLAGKNIKFLGQIDDETLIHHYQHAKALIFPQEEDFGLVPIEAQASGTPVIAYGKGGALETIKDKKTGLFFYSQTAEGISEAVLKFERLKIDYEDCIHQAKLFSSKLFLANFSAKVDSLYKKYKKEDSKII